MGTLIERIKQIRDDSRGGVDLKTAKLIAENEFRRSEPTHRVQVTKHGLIQATFSANTWQHESLRKMLTDQIDNVIDSHTSVAFYTSWSTERGAVEIDAVSQCTKYHED